VVDTPDSSDIFILNTEKRITSDGLDSCASQLLRVGTTIITARGTVGKLAIAGIPMAMNQSCYAVTGKDQMGDFFTYFLVREAVAALKANTHGSVFDTITRETFKSVSALIPSLDCVEAFEKAVQPMMERILANGKECLTLASTRNLLLPNLISGKLRVDSAGDNLREVGHED
jgi:type I restriction enzyme S subunit